MLKDNFLVKEYSNRIRNRLMESGLTKEQADKSLILLLTQAFEDIGETLLKDLPQEKKDIVDKLIDEHAEPDELASALEVDEEKIEDLYIGQLEKYLYNLNSHIDELKNKILQSKNNPSL